MGRKREVFYENGRLKGKYLDSETCRKLEHVISLNERQGNIYDLKHLIYELPQSDIDEIVSSRGEAEVNLQKGTLEDSQTLGVAFMYFAKRCILGDSVGLGKTVEVAGLFNLLEKEYLNNNKEFRFLYLTQKTIIPEAVNKLIKFTGNYVQTVYGEKDKVQKFLDNNSYYLNSSVVGAHSLITNTLFQDYINSFYNDTGECPFDILVIDESGSILSNTSAKKGKNSQMFDDAKFMSKLFDRVVLLNATPFEGSLDAFFNQLTVLDDTFLPTKTEFNSKYKVFDYYSGIPSFSGKYRNADGFRKLVGYRYFARTRKFLGAEMKDCTADLVIVPKSKEQIALAKKTSMYQMVIDCPDYFNMGIPTNIDTTPKLRALLRVLEEWSEADSVLIYARYKSAQNAIYETLCELGYIYSAVMNGETPDKEREDICNKFRLGEINILITNVQKGLDFDNCNHCVFYNYDPNPSNMVQFEGRMTRSFNIVNKHVKVLVSKGIEYNTFKKVIAERAKASDKFAGSDFSCVMELLQKDLE